MTFLNPLVLFGLIAAAIPFILHLLNLQKLRTIEFSTLTFLKELQQTKIRRLKFRQLLLLAIRTLLIAMVVMAFARPALRGTILGGFGAEAHTTMLFILDDSFSMTASDEHGQFFKQAKDALLSITNLVKDGDEIFFLRLSDLPMVTISPATHDIDVVRTAIRESRVSDVRRPLSDALELASTLIGHSFNPSKEIYIASDMQQTLFTDLGHSPTSSLPFNNRTRIFLVSIGNKSTSNTCIDSLRVVSTILESGKPVDLWASVRNFGDAPVSADVISLYLDGIKVAQQNVSISPWGSAAVNLSIIPKRSGFLKGYAEIEPDAIDPDNRRYFCLYIPERINVAFVSPSEHDDQYLLLALQAGTSAGTPSHFSLQHTSMDKFPFLDLGKVDVLVCTNVESFSPSIANRIRDFVNRGGGLMIFPGSGMDSRNYNTTLLASLSIPPIEEITRQPDVEGGISFATIDLDHPIFEAVFEKGKTGEQRDVLGTQSPTILQSLRRQTGRQGQTIISLSNGSPFLSEYRVGSGKILFFSVPPDLTWSDFPLKGLFAPLIHCSVEYLSPQATYQVGYMSGDAPSLSISITQSGGTDSRFTLVAPDSTESILQPEHQSEQSSQTARMTFPLGPLREPGFYDIRKGTSTLACISVNPDSKESDTRKITEESAAKFWRSFGVAYQSLKIVPPTEQLVPTVLQARFGVELWRYCAGLAILLALLEMAVARDSRKASQNAS